MTKQELITNIRLKMDNDALDNIDDYYTSYYMSLIDECLSVVANTVIPYQGCFVKNWGGYVSDTSCLNEQNKEVYFTAEIDMTLPSGVIAKRKDWIEFKDGKWDVQKRNNYGYITKLPNDFLSFSDESAIEFRNDQGDLFLNVDILYVNTRTIALSKDGNYKIYYNAEYPSVADNDDLSYIPLNVLKIIPTYVAGQLLMNDDPSKAVQLKNEFEIKLSRLDNNMPTIPYSINNDSGWTL